MIQWMLQQQPRVTANCSVSLLVSEKGADTAPEREAKTELQEGKRNESYHCQLDIPSLKAQEGLFKLRIQQKLARRHWIQWRNV